MGACLKLFMNAEEPPTPKVKVEQPPASDRQELRFTAQTDKEQSIYGRGSNIEIESNFSTRQTKIFFKSKSTALFSSFDERKYSPSYLQFTLDHESMIVKPENGSEPDTVAKDYYTLVDKVAFVRKTQDRIKVTTPEGQSELKCHPQYLFSTLTVSEGLPADCLGEVGPNKIIQVDNSPLKLRLKLKCQNINCKKLMKATFCKGIVSISTMQCPNCQRKEWSIEDIQCNFPVWGGGSKIDNHEKIDPAPSVLRAMGCVICLKFTNCQTMKCGCKVCKACLSAQENLSLDQQCWMCQGNSYIL